MKEPATLRELIAQLNEQGKEVVDNIINMAYSNLCDYIG